MIKKFWLLLGLIALLPLASALNIDEGDIYNQQQLDNFNLSSYDTAGKLAELLECQKEGSEFKRLGWYVVPYSCLRVFEYNETNYIIQRQTDIAKIHIQSYRKCKSVLGAEICDAEYIGQLKSQVKNKLAKIVKWIENHKTPDESGFDEDDFDGGLW